MSGFDDDFGEMVGGKNEGGAAPAVDDVIEDPAAEFLAREQEQLGDLETEIGPLSGKIDNASKKKLLDICSKKKKRINAINIFGFTL